MAGSRPHRRRGTSPALRDRGRYRGFSLEFPALAKSPKYHDGWDVRRVRAPTDGIPAGDYSGRGIPGVKDSKCWERRARKKRILRRGELPADLCTMEFTTRERRLRPRQKTMGATKDKAPKLGNNNI